jgi:polygalacturonase
MPRFVSVDDFGAIGDGATNDRVAFQNALNNAAADGSVVKQIECRTVA